MRTHAIIPLSWIYCFYNLTQSVMNDQVIASKSKVYMVLEYVDGGELFEQIVSIFYIWISESTLGCFLVFFVQILPDNLVFSLDVQASKGKLSEAAGRKIFQQLVDGVSYCHNKGVFHRDLKVKIS